MKQQRWEEAGKESDEKKSEEKESAEKNWEFAKHSFFPMFCGFGKQKIGSLKQRLRNHVAGAEMKNHTDM